MSLIERLMHALYRPKHKVDEDKTDELIFDATNRILKLEAALQRIRDHDKIILGEHMDEVRQIAREALE